MTDISVHKLITDSLPKNKWVNLAQVVPYFRTIDPDFHPSKYNFEKVKPMLESVPQLVKLKKNDAVFPPSYDCLLIDSSGLLETTPVHPDVDTGNNFSSLFKRYKEQNSQEFFAHFPWDEHSGENWESPFARLAGMAKPEPWDFQNPKLRTDEQSFPILRNYLNNTFLRLQQQNKIAYSKDGSRACFNTGLQTPLEEKDIFATFYKSSQCNTAQWTLYDFADSYSHKLSNYDGELPKVASYIQDVSDLVFDLSYNLEINIEHIVLENAERLPEEIKGNAILARQAIEGATRSLKEKIRRNYKIAIPQWYNNRIQLLLPLAISSEDSADIALVADKDSKRKIYRIKTALTMDMAYINARLICHPEKEWLTP